ncbi:MAG: flagellar export chaperone FliS [Candidatus Riflebacteria bacterium HGW-Riflebacteria-1]|jgi:flagellar protein FliS|nr:MAG: flagellar export chaperone FliS [Candidatus Riflebacteria bacterium HGW-Riflebacteria-1]
MNNPYNQKAAYRKTQVETASPEALILMLYDGALKFMGQTEIAFAANDIEQISNLLLRVQAIFAELMTALDKEKGGEIAVNLERLYVFFLEKLGDANVKKDIAPMLEIKPLVQNLRNTWELAMQRHQNAAPATPPRPRLNVAV